MLKHYSGKCFTTEIDKVVDYSLLCDVNSVVIKIHIESVGVHRFDTFASDNFSKNCMCSVH